MHTRASRLSAWLLLLLGLACLAASVVLFSPWVGAVATVFSAGGLLLLFAPHAPEIHSDALAAAFQEDWLPQQLGDWQRVEYKAEERDRSSDEGQFTRKWIYRSDDHVASVSTDFPFLGWHELTRCYKARGWTEEKRSVRKVKGAGSIVVVDLSKPNGESGYLLFSLFDGSAQPVEPRSTHWPGVRGKLARSPLLPLFGLGDRGISPTQTTLQIQMFIGGTYPLDESQRQKVEDTYLDARQRIVERWQTDILEDWHCSRNNCGRTGQWSHPT